VILESGRIRRYKIVVEPELRLDLPVFCGSMIRGAIGHALLHCYCRCGNGNGNGALLHQDDCLYASLFETGAGNAFVISPPAEGVIQPGESFSFHVTLLRDDPEHVGAFFNSLATGLKHGLGVNKIPCRLYETIPVFSDILSLEQSAYITLSTPWFIKYGGRPVRASELTVHSFLIAVAQRQRTLLREKLIEIHVPENPELLALADTLDSRFQVRDVSGVRRSNRQGKVHPLSGIIGTLELHSLQEKGLESLSSLLNRSQWLHGGGKVSFGLGGLVVQAHAGLH
jgi:hypothetical protein